MDRALAILRAKEKRLYKLAGKAAFQVSLRWRYFHATHPRATLARRRPKP